MCKDESDWKGSVDSDSLQRYRKDGNDLSLSVNQGQRISDLRNLMDMSATSLAIKSGANTKEILGIEAGLQELTPELGQRIANALGVQFSDVWVGDIK